MTINIMLDLETWGTDPGCDIRSIGACVFDPEIGLVEGWDTHSIDSDNPALTFYTAVDNPETPQDGSHFAQVMPRRYNLTRDPETVQWWSEQSDEAQAAFADPIDLREGLDRFDQWLVELTRNARYIEEPAKAGNQWPGLRLWSHGPGFDPPILAAAYRAVGLPIPWHYRALRDTRTIFDAAGIDDHSAWLKQHPGPLGIPHHALDDAISQARAVCGAWARIDRTLPIGLPSPMAMWGMLVMIRDDTKTDPAISMMINQMQDEAS